MGIKKGRVANGDAHGSNSASPADGVGPTQRVISGPVITTIRGVSAPPIMIIYSACLKRKPVI